MENENEKVGELTRMNVETSMKKVKDGYKKHGSIIRCFVLLILPILISLFWLFPPYEKIELSRNVEQNVKIVTISHEKILQPSIKNSIRNIFSVPFDLEWYKVCFEDRGSHGVYIDGTIAEGEEMELTWNLNFNNETNLTIEPKSYNCTLVKYNKKFVYTWEGTFAATFTAAMVKESVLKKQPAFEFRPDTTSYAIPEISGIIVKTFLFIISWASLFFLFTGIIRKIKHGFIES